MEHPVAVAFCPILFGKNGGQFDRRGLPFFQQEYDAEGNPIIPSKGKCDRPYDCGTCPYMHEWVTVQMNAGWQVGWECVHCLKETFRKEDRVLPGFYQAARRPVMPDHEDYDPDRPPLHGCTRCGHECSFVQLVLRR